MSDTGVAPAGSVAEAAATMRDASRYWWIFLVTGAAWLLFAIIVFRFDFKSVSSISILFGIAMIAAGVNELLSIPGATSGWKIAYALLALAFIVIGIVAFVHPGNTFDALAAVMSFYFIIKGLFTVVVSLMMRHEELWWLALLVGLAELAIGFWAAGDFGHRQILLLVWVGLAAFTRGITQIVFAFSLRSVKNAPA